MPYAVRLTNYIGGEVRWTSAPYSLESSTQKLDTTEEESSPEKTRPDLLDYCSELETACRARLSGFGELPVRKTKFTRAGSLAIQRAARAIDDMADTPGDILFFTGTLPGTGAAQYEAIARWSSWMVHRLKAWVGKRVEAKYDFYCWELQKRGALHLHYALYCPDPEKSFEIRSEIKKEWIALLDEVSSRSGVDLYLNKSRGFTHAKNKKVVQADCQQVEKSVGAYLGKYLSKASGGENSTGVFGPCRWYGISRAARDLEASLRRSLRLTFSSMNQWEGAIDDLKRILENISDTAFGWANKVIAGEGGVGYGVSSCTLDELLQLHFGERMSYANINTKIRDLWFRLQTRLNQIEQHNKKWIETLSRKHPSLSDWESVVSFSGQDITTPNGIEKMQHISWAIADVLRDPRNTWKPRLEQADKNALIYLTTELDSALVGLYCYDYTEETPLDMR